MDLSEKIKEQFKQQRERRRTAARAMKRKAKSVKHVPQHMKVSTKDERKRLRPAEPPASIKLIDVPQTITGFTPEIKRDNVLAAIKRIARFYGQNNKYTGKGELRES